VVEFFAGSTGWLLFFLALSAYVGWGFFLSGQPDQATDDQGRTPPPPGTDKDG
jgi:hypothetical protein